MPFPFRLLRRAVQARAETTGVAVRMQQPWVGSAAGFGSRSLPSHWIRFTAC